MNEHVLSDRNPVSKHPQQSRRPPFERIAILLQGVGALGAYQAGVYQGLARPVFIPTGPHRLPELQQAFVQAEVPPWRHLIPRDLPKSHCVRWKLKMPIASSEMKGRL